MIWNGGINGDTIRDNIMDVLDLKVFEKIHGTFGSYAIVYY